MSMGKLGSGIVDRDLDQLTALFQLLSDKTRVRILLALAEGERNVTALCECLGLPQPTVSHHLGLMRARNLIGNRREGKQIFYALNGAVNVADAGGLQLDAGNLAVNILAANG
jgi:DNA-binding transcriptional ArsR family regulator